MTAIHLGPHPVQPARLYDLPEPRLKLTPRLVGAATAVGLVYAAGGMMLNLAGIEFTIPSFTDPPAITVEYTPPEIPIEPPRPAETPVQPQPTVVQPQPTFMETPTMTEPVDPVVLAPSVTTTVPEPGPIVPTAAPATAPPPPVPAVIRNPSWLSKPTAAQLGRLYPDRAAERGMRGSVTMECRVAASGAVNNCVVLRESPTGYGFGDAALQSTRYFRLNPRTVDGQAIEGARVQIPMGFNLSE